MMGTGSNSRLAAIGVTLLLSTICSSVARADEAADDAARAEALYFEGRELAERNNYAEALTRFEESLRMRDSPKTVLYIVDCEAKLGRRIHAARRLVAVFPRLGDQPELRPIAEQERDQIFGQIGRLEVRLRRAAAGVTVAVDGVPWAPDDKGALFVEPGEHRIVMRQPGHVSRDFTVQIVAGQWVIRDEEPLPVAPAVDHQRSTVMWHPGPLGGIGIAGVVTSVATGVAALVIYQNLEVQCPFPRRTPCLDNGVALKDTIGQTLSWVSLGSGVLGGVALAGSYVSFRMSIPRPPASRAPQVSHFELGIGTSF